MNKLIWLTIFFLGSVMFAQNSIHESIKTFEKAFQNKDYTSMKNLLAPQFTVGAGDSSSNEFYLNTIFNAFPILDSLQIVKSQKVKNEIVTTVYFFFKGKEKIVSDIVFNSEQKMLYVTSFDDLYKINRNAEVKKVTSIPFELIENRIALKVKLNKSDREFLMLFDTGADGMALNPDSAYKAGVVVTKTKSVAVVGGTQDVKYSADNTIYLGSQMIQNQALVIFPKHSIYDGSIGANLLRNYIVSVNFDTMTIDLYNFGKFNYSGKAKIFVFDYQSGIPLVKVNLSFEDKKTVEGNFTFDTGADYSLIVYGPFNGNHNLDSSLKTDYLSINQSFAKQTKISSGTIPSVSINGNNFANVPIALQEYQPDNKNWAAADGSLGIDLIKRFNFTIDLLHKTVYLEPNKNYKKTFSFFLSGIVMDFDENQDLIVRAITDHKNENLKKIKPGAKIIKINDFEAKELLNIENLKKLKNNKEIDFIIEQDNKSMLISL